MKKISFKIMLAIIICSITTSTILFFVNIKQTSAVMNDEVERTLSYASEKYSNQLSIDFKNILANSTTAGLKYFFVEQDKTPGDPFVSIKKSIDYIRKNLV